MTPTNPCRIDGFGNGSVCVIKGIFVVYFCNIDILTVGFCTLVMLEEYLGDNA